MIVLTAGYPSAGKSLVCEKIKDKLLITCFDPKDFYLPEYEELDEDDRKQVAIAAWEICLESLYNDIRDSDNNEAVIFDSCMANKNQFSHIVDLCSQHKHDLIVIFVHCPIKICKERHKDEMDDGVWRSYKDRIISILPEFDKFSRKVFLIKNDKGESDIDVSKIVSFLETEANAGN